MGSVSSTNKLEGEKFFKYLLLYASFWRKSTIIVYIIYLMKILFKILASCNSTSSLLLHQTLIALIAARFDALQLQSDLSRVDWHWINFLNKWKNENVFLFFFSVYLSYFHSFYINLTCLQTHSNNFLKKQEKLFFKKKKGEERFQHQNWKY